MEGTNQVLINYYARLINKGNWTMNQVPEADREAVQKAINDLKMKNNETNEN